MHIGRRSWLELASLGMGAGASTSLPACKLGNEQAQLEERLKKLDIAFAGQDPKRGHLLRTIRPDQKKISSERSCDVLIVGGGVSGLSAAWHLLEKNDLHVEILELEDEVGGNARGGQLGPSAHPMAAHYLPEPPSYFSELHQLLEDLGIRIGTDAAGRPLFRADSICKAPQERHLFQGQWHPGVYPFSGESLEEEEQWKRWKEHLWALDGLRDQHQRRAFSIPVRDSSDKTRHLDQISMSDYLIEQGFDSWRLRWLVNYACRDEYGCTLDQTSAFAGLHRFLARGLDENRNILTWPEGNSHLTKNLAAVISRSHTIRTGHAVLSINSDKGSVIALDISNHEMVRYQSKFILWAAPLFLLPHVLSNIDSNWRTAISKLEYAPWLVANLALRERPQGFGAPLAWDNVSIEGSHLGYVLANHNDSLSAPKRECVLTYYEPMSGQLAKNGHSSAELQKHRSTLLRTNKNRVATRVLGEMEKMHPGISTQVIQMRLHRWGHAMIRPRPNLIFGETLRMAKQAHGRLLACASDTMGLSIFESAFYSGLDGAQSALQFLRKNAL